MTVQSSCKTCGQDHGTGCSGHSKTTKKPCGGIPMRGQSVCRMHGGSSKNARAAGAARVAAAKADVQLRRGLAAAYGEHVPNIDPAEAMLQAVSWKYAEVLALRSKVAELDDDGMVWGVTREKTGGDDQGTTQEARPNVWWVMLRSAEEQLVKFTAAARAAGCDERRLRLAESQGDLTAQVLRAVLVAMLDVVVTLVRSVGDVSFEPTLTAAWNTAVAEIVPRELRALITAGSVE